MNEKSKEICCGVYLKCSVCGHGVHSPHYYEDGSKRSIQKPGPKGKTYDQK